MTTVHSAQGRDYSSWQSVMDLAGLDFVVVRATIGDGALTVGGAGAVEKGVDAKFAHFWQQAAQAGIVRGAYHFLYPNLSATVQAKLFVNTVKAHGLKPGDILVCDSETLSTDVDGQTLAFCEAVSALVGPRNPVLPYTNQNVGQHLTRTAARYPDVWFAHPSGTAPSASFIAPFPRWRFWQWGTVGGVDADAYNGTPASLRDWIATYTQGDPVSFTDQDKADINTAVWRMDNIPAPADAPDLATNPTWTARSYLADIDARVRRLETHLSDLGARMDVLASAVGALNADAVVQQLQAAIGAVKVTLTAGTS